MDGHVHAFAFFGGVPQSVLYDSDEDQKSIRGIDFPTNRCLVSKILADGTVKPAMPPSKTMAIVPRTQSFLRCSDRTTAENTGSGASSIRSSDPCLADVDSRI